MAGNPLISIVIPTYKRPHRLERSISSVLKQTYTNWEIIIVDDNDEDSPSRRDTVNFMLNYTSDNRIKYIKHKKNMGGGLARNAGVKHACGKFIAFLDDDDEFLPTKLEKQLDKFRNSKFKKLGAVYCRSKTVDSSGKLLRYSNVRVSGNVLTSHLLRNVTPCPTIFIEKEVLKSIGGFRDLPSGQEYEMMLRFFAKGYEIDFVDEILVVFHSGEYGSISTSKNKIDGTKKIYKIQEKYFNYLTKPEIRKVKHSYFLSLYRQYMDKNDKKNALKYYKKAINEDFVQFENLIESLTFVLGYSAVLKLKKYLHIITNMEIIMKFLKVYLSLQDRYLKR